MVRKLHRASKANIAFPFNTMHLARPRNVRTIKVSDSSHILNLLLDNLGCKAPRFVQLMVRPSIEAF